jgi:hypothetical protein
MGGSIHIAWAGWAAMALMLGPLAAAGDLPHFADDADRWLREHTQTYSLRKGRQMAIRQASADQRGP